MSNPFSHEKRKRLTAQDYAKVFATTNGKCASCRRHLRPGDKWSADHVIALENGGSDEIENMQPLCFGCHALKTAEDHAKAGHSRRVYSKHFVPKEYQRSRAWRR